MGTALRTYGVWLLLGLTGLGCGAMELGEPTPSDTFIDSSDPADLTTMETVRRVFELSHPETSLESILTTMFATDFAAEAGQCPAKIDASNASTIDITYIGGCTNEGATSAADDDQMFAGQIHMQGRPDQYVVHFDHFLISGEEECGGSLIPETVALDGTVEVSEGFTANDVTYRLKMLYDAETLPTERSIGSPCATRSVTYGFDYVVEVITSGADADGNGEPDELITFGATGKMASLDVGSWTTTAMVEHSSIDEIADGTDCMEPLTGEITVSAAGHTATLFADGATNCTLDACASWELDGTMQPTELCGVRGCSLSGRPTRLPSVLFLLLSAFALAWMRRRAIA